MHSKATRTAFVALAVGLALAVSGCSGDSTTPAASSSSTSSASNSASPVTLEGGWVKAQDSNMTGVFGTLKNSSDKDVTLVGGSSPVAGLVEVHEMVMKDGKMVMQAKAGGLTVKAKGEAKLAPGQDHIMLMQLKSPIKAGDKVELTVKDTTGATFTVTLEGRTTNQGNEPYHTSGGSPAPGGSMGTMSGKPSDTANSHPTTTP